MVDAAEVAEVDFGAEEVDAGGGDVGLGLVFLEVGRGLGEGLQVATEGGDGGGCFGDGAGGDYEDEVGEGVARGGGEEFVDEALADGEAEAAGGGEVSFGEGDVGKAAFLVFSPI